MSTQSCCDMLAGLRSVMPTPHLSHRQLLSGVSLPACECNHKTYWRGGPDRRRDRGDDSGRTAGPDLAAGTAATGRDAVAADDRADPQVADGADADLRARADPLDRLSGDDPAQP